MEDSDENRDLGDWEEIEIREKPEYEKERVMDDEFDEFRKRVKDSERFDTEEEVFDVATLRALYKLVSDGVVEAIGRPVSTGKEGNVFEAVGEDRDLALKIYRINTSSFKDMRYYLEGDPRFEGIRDQKKEVVLAWVRKEFSNLKRAREAGVRVPEPIAVERNILAMEFIGVGAEGKQAPQLKEVEIENPETAFEVVAEYMERLYDAGLVHGDLSEYNILVYDGDLVVIDVGQAVTVHHPNSRDILKTDCKNVARFFSSLGVEVTKEGLLERVAGKTD
ncbi:MAG: serine protein kinase RIO [Halobacteria archaeon]|nr:serine protein kinase RIO [Halobacteria archaeon]